MRPEAAAQLPSVGATTRRTFSIFIAMGHDRPRTPAEVLTIATIDSVIERATLSDWIELRAAALARAEVLADLRCLCHVRTPDLYDPFSDGHRAWLAYIDCAMSNDASCCVLRQAFMEAGGQQ